MPDFHLAAHPASLSQNLTFANLRDVFLLYIIPVGGGIPGGVLLASARGIAWPISAAIYFVSDVLLACAFEPLMYLLMAIMRRYSRLTPVREALRRSVVRAMAHYGHRTGPLALILIAFGVDPMTGRAAARLAGHGFVTGWLIAICGDMIYFFLLMISTLWLNSLLGDGTLTMLIILLLMIVLPSVIRRFRGTRMAPPPTKKN